MTTADNPKPKPIPKPNRTRTRNRNQPRRLRRDTFRAGMDRLGHVFTRSAPTMDPGMLSTWYDLLRDVPDTRFRIAVTEICRTATFFPALAEIYQAARDPYAGAISDPHPTTPTPKKEPQK